MFTVKATYRGENRRFSFDSSAFPTFEQLYTQLYRVFPIHNSYYLSNLNFSPNTSYGPGRLLIGSEAHSAEEYNEHTAPYRANEWPGALLRFSVHDEIPHKLPSTASAAGNSVRTGATPSAPASINDGAGSDASSATAMPSLDSLLRNSEERISMLDRLRERTVHRPRPDSGFFESEISSPEQKSTPFLTSHSPLWSPFDNKSGQRANDSPVEPSGGLNVAAATGVNTPMAPQSIIPESGQQPRPRLPAFLDLRPRSSVSTQATPLPPVPALPRPPLPPPPTRFPSFIPAKVPTKILVSDMDVEMPSPKVSNATTAQISTPPQPKQADAQFTHDDIKKDLNEIKEMLVDMRGELKKPSSPTPPATTPPEAPKASHAPSTLSSAPFSSRPPYGPFPPIPPPPPVPYRPSYISPLPPFPPPPPLPLPPLSSFTVLPVPNPNPVSAASRPPKPNSVRPHTGITCDACKSDGFSGVRFKCLECDDFDLCSLCMSSPVARNRHDHRHSFWPIDEPGNKAWFIQAKSTVQTAKKIESEPVRAHHPHVNCDSCDTKGITGVRYKCLECEDYDLCEKCWSSSAGHLAHPLHPFWPINTPAQFPSYGKARNRKESAIRDTAVSASSVVHLGIHCDGCEAAPIVGVRFKCLQCEDYDLCSSCASSPAVVGSHNKEHKLWPVTEMSNLSAYYDARPKHHGSVFCDACAATVIGVRFKCLQCENFDLCGQCMSDPDLVGSHNMEHKFWPVTEPRNLDHYHRFKPKVHMSVTCDGCDTRVVGVRHKCLECDDFDFCTSCLSDPEKRKSHPAKHSFFPITAPGDKTEYNVARFQSTPASETVPTSETVHRNTVCDACSNTIDGARYKCLDCPDYDLCQDCVLCGAREAHDPFHSFFEIENPGDVFVHTVFTGNGEWVPYSTRPNNATVTTSSQSSQARETQPATQESAVLPPAPATDVEPVNHDATCNLCDSRISGDRYKCVNCPDFDTCSSCFAITPEHHPGHGFVIVKTPETLIIRNALRTDIAHPATCNNCNNIIRGTRYKCMHPSCPDYDLCQNCEAHPFAAHPETHPMLKMTKPTTFVPTVVRDVSNSVPTVVTIPSPSPIPVQVETVMDNAIRPEPVFPPPTAPLFAGWSTREGDAFIRRVQRMRTPTQMFPPSPIEPENEDAEMNDAPEPPSLPTQVDYSDPYADTSFMRPISTPVVASPFEEPIRRTLNRFPRARHTVRDTSVPSTAPVPMNVDHPSDVRRHIRGLFTTDPATAYDQDVGDSFSRVADHLKRMQEARRVMRESFPLSNPIPDAPPVPALPVFEPITEARQSPFSDPIPDKNSSGHQTPQSDLSASVVDPFHRPQLTPQEERVPVPAPCLPPVFSPSWSPPRWPVDDTPPCPVMIPHMLATENTPPVEPRRVASPILVIETSPVEETVVHSPTVLNDVSPVTPVAPSPPALSPPSPAVPEGPLVDLDEPASPAPLLDTVHDETVSSSFGGLTTPSEVRTTAPVPAVASVTSTPKLPVQNSEWKELWPELTTMLKHLLQPPTPEASTSSAMPGSIQVEEVFKPEVPKELLSATTEEFLTPVEESPLAKEALLHLPEGTAPRSIASSTTIPVSQPKRFNLQEYLTTLVPKPLVATFVADNNIPDGQIFPPGAEFVKSWRMRNDGETAWPETTELVFVAGDKLMNDDSVKKVKIGAVPPGAEVEVVGAEMKAPDVPGKYVSYWRLNDGVGAPFGHSVWVDIIVAEVDKSSSGDEESLASSTVIMPKPLENVETAPTAVSPHTPNSTATLSMTIPSNPASDDGSFESSISLIDAPLSPSMSLGEEDELLYAESNSLVEVDDEDEHPTRRIASASPTPPTAEQAGDMEYVVLYETSSSSSGED